MGITNKTELTNLVKKVLEGDPDSFDVFNKEYGKIIYTHTIKWAGLVQKVSMNLYDFEDLNNEIWEFVIKRLPYYDAEKSAMTTFLYMVCNQCAERIMMYNGRQMRYPGDDAIFASLDACPSGFIGEGDMTLGEFIMDENTDVEQEYITEELVFTYIHSVAESLNGQSPNKKMAFMHLLKGLTLEQSAQIIGVTRECVRQYRKKVLDKIDYNKHKNEIFSSKLGAMFCQELLLRKEDDVLVEELSYDIGTIKICREMLSTAGIRR